MTIETVIVKRALIRLNTIDCIKNPVNKTNFFMAEAFFNTSVGCDQSVEKGNFRMTSGFKARTNSFECLITYFNLSKERA